MNKPDRIVEGDIVNVYFLMSGYLNKAKVINVPTQTGEMWIFRTKNNELLYVNPCGADLTRIERDDNVEVDNSFSQVGSAIADTLTQEEQ